MTKTKRSPGRVCAHCQKAGPGELQYMVHNDIWLSRAKANEILHLECLETRLGRQITLDDLTAAPINLHLRMKMKDPTIRGKALKCAQWEIANRMKAGREEADDAGLYGQFTIEEADLPVCTVVMALKNLDPEGADVRKRDMGFVYGEAGCYHDNAGPIVHWFKGGCCNVYPGDVAVIWFDATEVSEGVPFNPPRPDEEE